MRMEVGVQNLHIIAQVANTPFLCESPEDVLQAVALGLARKRRRTIRAADPAIT
jgi:hypothetical protein